MFSNPKALQLLPPRINFTLNHHHRPKAELCANLRPDIHHQITVRLNTSDNHRQNPSLLLMYALNHNHFFPIWSYTPITSRRILENFNGEELQT